MPLIFVDNLFQGFIGRQTSKSEQRQLIIFITGQVDRVPRKQSLPRNALRLCQRFTARAIHVPLTTLTCLSQNWNLAAFVTREYWYLKRIVVPVKFRPLPWWNRIELSNSVFKLLFDIRQGKAESYRFYFINVHQYKLIDIKSNYFNTF